MNNIKIDLETTRNQLPEYIAKLRRYSLFIFIILVIVIYAFVLYRINSLNNTVPSDAVINTQVKDAKVPYIDKNLVRQVQSLQDNSVSVQSLFDQARNNPFQ